jgi:Zn-dependent M28 family amino/carboxypeptidase
VADINMESLNYSCPTRDINLVGATDANLLAAAGRVARGMDLRIRPSHADPAGLRFRCDSFSFSTAGVPAVSPGFSLDGGWEFTGNQAACQAQAGHFKEIYHTPADRYNPAWDLGGMVQQAQFALNLGFTLAEVR